MVNLPVASPRAGSPTQKGNDAEQAHPAENHRSRRWPCQSRPKPVPSRKPPNAAAPDKETDSARISRLSLPNVWPSWSGGRGQQEEAALARLRNKVKNPGAGGPVCRPAAAKRAGSDYPAYMQSRLKDAFHETISYSSKNPEMTVRLFIDTDGKLSRKKTERSSGDRAFEMSVLRAIDAPVKNSPRRPTTRFSRVFLSSSPKVLPKTNRDTNREHIS